MNKINIKKAEDALAWLQENKKQTQCMLDAIMTNPSSVRRDAPRLSRSIARLDVTINAVQFAILKQLAEDKLAAEAKAIKQQNIKEACDE